VKLGKAAKTARWKERFLGQKEGGNRLKRRRPKATSTVRKLGKKVRDDKAHCPASRHVGPKSGKKGG